MLRGDCPGASLLCSSRLIPLDKPQGGIRPIAIGEIIYRLCMKALVRHVYKPDFLAPFQLGVRSPGGVEPIIACLQGAVDKSFPHEWSEVTLVDKTNAFNTMSRDAIAIAVATYAPALYPLAAWAYNNPSALVVTTDLHYHVITSSAGVRQGDPLSALLFSLGSRSYLEALQHHLGPASLVLAYLDDEIILTSSTDVLDTVSRLSAEFSTGLSINRTKSKTLTLDYIRAHGLELLGSVVGPSTARARFLTESINSFQQSITHTLHLPSQYSLLLLRTTLMARIRHLTRTISPADTSDCWKQADVHVAATVSALRWSPPNTDATIDHDTCTLPIRKGGLGLVSFFDTAPHAYAAGLESSLLFLSTLVPSIDPPTTINSQRSRCRTMHDDHHLSLLGRLASDQCLTVVENSSAFGRRWLSTIPSAPQLRLSDNEISYALRHWTLSLVKFPHCRMCGELDCPVLHIDSCRGTQPIRTRRHEFTKYALGRALDTAPGAQIEYEPLVFTADRGPGHVKYNDIRFSGSPESDLPPMEFDIKVITVQPTRPPPLYFLNTLNGDPLSNALARAQHFLGLKATLARQQVEASTPADPMANPLASSALTLSTPGVLFFPAVISAGGMTETEFAQTLSKMQRKLPPGAFSFMSQVLSIGFIKYRNRSLRAIEDGPRPPPRRIALP